MKVETRRLDGGVTGLGLHRFQGHARLPQAGQAGVAELVAAGVGQAGAPPGRLQDLVQPRRAERSAPSPALEDKEDAIAPSADAIVRLAEALDVSCDYLLLDNAPRRPLHAAENTLGDRLSAVAELSEDDLASLRNVIDGLVAKSRLKALAGGIS